MAGEQKEKHERLERALARLNTFLHDPELDGLDLGPWVATLGGKINSSLEGFRTGQELLKQFDASDPSGQDPTINTRRRVELKQLVGIETDLQKTLPHELKRLLAALMERPGASPFAEELEDILRPAPDWFLPRPEPAAALTVHFLETDPGDRQRAILQQALDIGKAFHYELLEKLSLSSEGATLLMTNKTTGQSALLHYVPEVESQKIEKEILALTAVYDLYRGEHESLAGLFFTLAPVDTGALEAESPMLGRIIGRKVRVYDGAEVVSLLAEGEVIAQPRKVGDVLSKTPLANGALALAYFRQDYYWTATAPDQSAITLLSGGADPLPPDVAQPVLEAMKGLVIRDALERYLDLTPSAQPAEAQAAPANRSVAKEHSKSDSWFDYKNPAHPDFFVGRGEESASFFRKVAEMRAGSYPSRGILVQSPSGAGKSSFIFKLQADSQTLDPKCFIYSVDSRGCYGPDFLGVVFDDFLSRLFAWRGLPEGRRMEMLALLRRQHTSFSHVSETARLLHGHLKADGLLAVLFFDQFEYLAPYPTVVRDIANLLTVLSNSRTNLVLGFALRSDMNLPRFSEFPFDAWSAVQKQAWLMELGGLDEKAEQQLIGEIEKEVGRRFDPAFVAEIRQFAKKRPWVLKRVGAHLVREYGGGAGVEDYKVKLRLEKFFDEDVRPLDDDQRKLLKVVARIGPASLQEITDAQQGLPAGDVPKVLNSLIDQRVVTKIGENFDTYHDRFKEYILQTLLDPEEKLRFEISTTLRTMRFSTGAGMIGPFMMILTGPRVIMLSRHNQDLCLSVTRELADLGFDMTENRFVVDDMNRDGGWSLLIYRLYALLNRIVPDDRHLRDRQQEVLESLLERLPEVTEEPQTGFIRSELTADRLLGGLTVGDLEENRNLLSEYVKPSTLRRELAKKYASAGETEKARALLPDMTPEDRYYSELYVAERLASTGELAAAEGIVNSLKDLSAQIVDDQSKRFGEELKSYVGQDVSREQIHTAAQAAGLGGYTREGEYRTAAELVAETWATGTVLDSESLEPTLKRHLEIITAKLAKPWREAHLEIARRRALGRDTEQVERMSETLDAEERAELTYWLARGWLAAGRREEALALVREMSTPRAAEIYLHLDMVDEATQLLDKYKERRLSEVEAPFVSGAERPRQQWIAEGSILIYLHAGKISTARELFKEADLDGDNVGKLYMKAASNFLMAGDFESAGPLLEQAVLEMFEPSRGETVWLSRWFEGLDWPFEAALSIWALGG